MKKIYMLALLSAGCVFLSSCGHNLGLVGVGTGWRLGNGEYGFSYGDGLFGTFITKDGAYFKAEIDSTTGMSFDPTTNSYKGIKSVEYSLPPQITGYAVDFAHDNPDVAKSYYDALTAYYSDKFDSMKDKKPEISDEKSKEASKSVSDVLKEAIGKAKNIVSGLKESKKAFECDGNCTYTDLSGNRDIEYQISIALKLLTYNGYEHKMAETGEYYTTTLEHFITENVGSQSRGYKETPLRIKAVTVKDNVIENLTYAFESNGEDVEIECPSCVCVP